MVSGGVAVSNISWHRCVTSVLAACSVIGTLRAGGLTFEDRVKAQEAIERVYWAHRIWPKENPQPKPPLEAVMPEAMIRAKVAETLEKSRTLEKETGRSITAAVLHAELDRMIDRSQAPQVLRELFDALGDAPELLEETLARTRLVNRPFRQAEWSAQVGGDFRLRLPATTGCQAATWSVSSDSLLPPRNLHTAVWTGAEMIVWGGFSGLTRFNTGSRYDPATDSW